MKFSSILRKFWLFGPVTAVFVAVVVTAIFTTMDVVRNYGDVFRDASGTRWPLVYETAVSWLIPTFLYVLVIATIGHLLFSGISMIYKKYFSIGSDASNT